MPALSFRAKLLLAMMLVVVGVTAATLSVAENKFQATYRATFTRLFKVQNSSISRQQEILLENIKRVSKNLVKSRRLQEALSAATESGESKILYQIAKSELETRKVLRSDTEDTNALGATFYFFLDADGKILSPPADALLDLKPLTNQLTLKRQLESVSHAIPQIEEPLAGFVTPETALGRMVLQQVVFTKVIDTPTGEPLGALALGFPTPDLGDNDSDADKFRAGILFENRLFSQSIPESKRESLANRVAQAIKSSELASEDFMEFIGDDPHRIFYQALNPDPHFLRASIVLLFSVKEVLATQRDQRGQIILSGVAGLVGALMISLLLAHGLSVPIRELVAGTTEVQRGNLQIQVPVRSRDEIGRLAAAFNEMTLGLALKEKYRSVLDKVSDKAVAEELMRGNVALGGETREVSVLFCDIRGFTALTQGMHPDEVIRMLNEHFTPLTRVVNEHHGVVDKFVGDLIMAIFGAPKSYGRDADDAARCALDMIQTRRQLNETSHYQIEIGIGVATGPAVAGNMGSANRLNYTVLGERVNLASRLCGQAGRMEVVIDETTRQRLQNAIRVTPMPDLLLKGFSSRVTAYKLLEIQPLPAKV